MTTPAEPSRERPGHAARTVTTNTLSVALANIANRVLMFAFYVVAARHLGVSEYGVLSGGLAFVTMFSVFTDLGLGNITAREIARDRSIGASYVGNSLSIVGLTALCVMCLVAMLANILNYPLRSVRVIYILCLWLVAGALTSYCAYVFLGLERMYVTAGAQLLQTLLLVGGGFLLARGPALAERYALLYTAAGVLVAAAVFLSAARLLGGLRFRFEFRQWWFLLKASIPVGIAAAVVSIYYWNGYTILQRIHGSAPVGILNAAFRLVVGACFAAMSLSAALFPLLSRYFAADPERLPRVFQTGSRYLTLLVLPVVILTQPLARPVVNLIYGSEYVPAAAVLRVLVWWGGVAAFSSLCSNYVLAANRGPLIMYQALVSLGVSVAGNLIMIPPLGAMGAAIALVTAEIAGLVLLLVFLRRARLAFDFRSQGVLMLRAALALVPALVPGIFADRTSSVPLWIAALLGSLGIYLLMLLVTGVIRQEDIGFIRSLLRKSDG
uniref:Uncharacterized protein n=1 Tax=candidate division WOR-3 bacterium TaxID=2052148 RepID=A0A7C4CCY6_UNCW3